MKLYSRVANKTEMTEINSKNQLQELCQARKWPMPQYMTTQCGLGWGSIVTINNAIYHNPDLGPYDRKKNAEMAIAQYALKCLEEEEMDTENNVWVVPFDKCVIDWDNLRVINLIDVESLPKYDCMTNQDHELIHFFATTNHPSVSKMRPSGMTFRTLVPSGYRDIADHALSFVAGKYLTLLKQHNNTQCEFRIFTKDHFARGLQEIILMENRRCMVRDF